MNARNLLYIKPFNPRKVVALADDKLKTKAFLAARGIPTAKIYARIENRNQLKEFDVNTLPNECVLKPNYGFGGEGILILKGRDKQGKFLIGGKYPVTEEEIKEHIEDILDGMFSVNGKSDTAFFEQILSPHNCFAKFRPAGLPDIRIIVFNMVPVMAMLRIPTSDSQGKANVHLGGIGIGIDISKGITTHAAQFHSIITSLPHGGSPANIQIPYWDEILLICSRIQQITNIGYLACDIAIDENMGPALLEVNARAGLMVQLANLAPLRARLEKVKDVKVGTPEKGVRMGKDLFGSAGSKSTTEEIPEKPILGTHESIVISCDGANIESPCIISPDQERTLFPEKLIEKIRDKGGLELEDKNEKTYKVKFVLHGKKLQTLISENKNPESEMVIIGRRDLTGFLIDPSKENSTPIKHSSVKVDVRAIDSTLGQIDRELLLIKHLKPVNLEEERQRAISDIRYNPLFQYPEPKVNLGEVEKKIKKPIVADCPLSILLEKKRRELLSRISLIRHRGNSDKFTEISRALFGAPSSALIRSAAAELHNRTACELPAKEKDLLSSEEVSKIFENILNKYGLHNWNVAIRQKLVANCTVGGQQIYLREDAKFSEIHAKALIAHEIETHILTAENGLHQPYIIFRNGCANYLDTQEGLATYNQNRIYGEHHEKRFNPPRNVLGVAYALDHSFAETRTYLHEELGFDEEKALTSAISMKRGLSDTSEYGAFTKSIVYYRGLRAIEHFIKEEGNIADLYIGKIAMEDLEQIKKITDLQPPLLLPNFLLDKEDTKKKPNKKITKKTRKKEIESAKEE
ncbi:MAG: DUF1704 domain-containing protein [Candidatus Peribacteraceae bacterium]|nr:DUF1704 domain-containing protein [Candidatus Peribacteraceae bacterium]